MTIYGWDASHHDWARGPMDIPAAVRDGIAFMTHKIGEARTVVDDRFDDWYRRARGVVPLLGAYYVNHPGDQDYQADRFLALLDARAPGWRTGPFILQVDAEKFEYMDRAPSPAECAAFCRRLAARTRGAYRPVLYAPKWLYGNRLAGVDAPLWASAYGTNPAAGYRSVYPGDNSSRWAAYSGKTPAILQYGSRTRIGSQRTCDANAYRGSLAQLRDLVYPGGKDDDMPSAQEIAAAVWAHPFGSRGLGVAPRPAADWAKDAYVANRTVAALAAASDIDEDAIITGVLSGLGARPVQDIAAALRAVLSDDQVAELGAALSRT